MTLPQISGQVYQRRSTMEDLSGRRCSANWVARTKEKFEYFIVDRQRSKKKLETWQHNTASIFRGRISSNETSPFRADFASGWVAPHFIRIHISGSVCLEIFSYILCSHTHWVTSQLYTFFQSNVLPMQCTDDNTRYRSLCLSLHYVLSPPRSGHRKMFKDLRADD